MLLAQQSWQPVPALTANIFALATNRVNTHDKTGGTIDIESLQNRLHKVCYVPGTSAGLNGLLFFSFFAAAINSTNEANKAGISSLYYLDVYGWYIP